MLHHGDVMHDIHEHRADPSLNFMVYVLVPMTLELGTIKPNSNHHEKVLAYTWYRLLDCFCRLRLDFQSFGNGEDSKGKVTSSQQKIINSARMFADLSSRVMLDSNSKSQMSMPSPQTSVDKMKALSLAVSLMGIRVCVSFGTPFLAKFYPDSWLKISAFIQHSFRDGSLQSENDIALWRFLSLTMTSKTPLVSHLRNFTNTRLKLLKAQNFEVHHRRIVSKQSSFKSPEQFELPSSPIQSRRKRRTKSVEIQQSVLSVLRKIATTDRSISKLEDQTVMEATGITSQSKLPSFSDPYASHTKSLERPKPSKFSFSFRSMDRVNPNITGSTSSTAIAPSIYVSDGDSLQASNDTTHGLAPPVAVGFSTPIKEEPSLEFKMTGSRSMNNSTLSVPSETNSVDISYANDTAQRTRAKSYAEPESPKIEHHRRLSVDESGGTIQSRTENRFGSISSTAGGYLSPPAANSRFLYPGESSGSLNKASNPGTEEEAIISSEILFHVKIICRCLRENNLCKSDIERNQALLVPLADYTRQHRLRQLRSEFQRLKLDNKQIFFVP
jgi:hypothetical protein